MTTSQTRRVRAWIFMETPKAYLLNGHNFKAKWLPKAYIKQIEGSKRESMLGDSYAWEIPTWLLK